MSAEYTQYNFNDDKIKLETYFQNSFSKPSYNILKQIKKFVEDDTVLEIGSGNGLYAYLLTKLGVKIKATDSCNHTTFNPYVVPNSNLECISHIEALKKYGKLNVLMFSFPVGNIKSTIKNIPEDDMTGYSLNSFMGNKLIYIGNINNDVDVDRNYSITEPVYFDDSTCSDAFRDLINRDWKLVKYLFIDKTVSRRESIYEYLLLFTRKNKYKDETNVKLIENLYTDALEEYSKDDHVYIPTVNYIPKIENPPINTNTLSEQYGELPSANYVNISTVNTDLKIGDIVTINTDNLSEPYKQYKDTQYKITSITPSQYVLKGFGGIDKKNVIYVPAGGQLTYYYKYIKYKNKLCNHHIE